MLLGRRLEEGQPKGMIRERVVEGGGKWWGGPGVEGGGLTGGPATFKSISYSLPPLSHRVMESSSKMTGPTEHCLLGSPCGGWLLDTHVCGI